MIGTEIERMRILEWLTDPGTKGKRLTMDMVVPLCGLAPADQYLVHIDHTKNVLWDMQHDGLIRAVPYEWNIRWIITQKGRDWMTERIVEDYAENVLGGKERWEDSTHGVSARRCAASKSTGLCRQQNWPDLQDGPTTSLTTRALACSGPDALNAWKS